MTKQIPTMTNIFPQHVFNNEKANYTNLQKLSEERQLILQNSLQLFDYYDECADFGKWLREKEWLDIVKSKNNVTQLCRIACVASAHCRAGDGFHFWSRLVLA